LRLAAGGASVDGMPVQDAAKVQAANATLEVEFSAIRRVCEVLETLTPPQRSAVITYVAARFQRWDTLGGGAELGDNLLGE
jgi:hypothetical protein